MRKLKEQKILEPRVVVEVKGNCAYCGEEMSFTFDNDYDYNKDVDQCTECGGNNYVHIAKNIWETVWKKTK